MVNKAHKNRWWALLSIRKYCNLFKYFVLYLQVPTIKMPPKKNAIEENLHAAMAAVQRVNCHNALQFKTNKSPFQKFLPTPNYAVIKNRPRRNTKLQGSGTYKGAV